jgi:hypothetical protein
MSDRPFSPRPNRRRFVAERVESAPPIEDFDLAAIDDDDDLPLLTEVVDLDAAAMPAPPVVPPSFTAADVDTVVANVEASLRAQLPALVAAAMATLEEDLKRGVTALVEDTLRDALNDYLPYTGPSDDEETEDATATTGATPASDASQAQPGGDAPV